MAPGTFDPTFGNERFRSDLKQVCGLLFVLSVCATFFPLANIAIRIGPDGVDSGTPFSSLFGGLCVVIIGLTGMAIGYLGIVHDVHNRYLTGFLLVWVQTAFIPYITDMTAVGQAARDDQPMESGLIPGLYNPTQAQLNFVAFTGILGILGFGAYFLGSLAFMAFSLFAYQSGKPADRTSGYYRGRLGFYCCLTIMIGLAQFMLGSFCNYNFGRGPLEPPINVAMFTVPYPEISIFVGIVYFINGTYGLMRALDLIDAREHDHFFQICVVIQYFWTLVLMIIVQVSYQPAGVLAAAAPSRACLTLGAHILPAYLDFKMRTTPRVLPANYYGLDSRKTRRTRPEGSPQTHRRSDDNNEEDVV